MSDIKPIAWALKRSDGLVLDVICPDEHDSIVGDYTTPLYPQSAIDAQAAEIARLRAALTELVAVKDLKDRTEVLHFAGPLSGAGEGWKSAYESGRREYIRRQPAAWDAARAALTPQPSAPQARHPCIKCRRADSDGFPLSKTCQLFCTQDANGKWSDFDPLNGPSA